MLRREVELSELRNRIVRMLFKQLMAPSEAIVDLAHQGLAVIILHTRMPKVGPRRQRRGPNPGRT